MGPLYRGQGTAVYLRASRLEVLVSLFRFGEGILKFGTKVGGGVGVCGSDEVAKALVRKVCTCQKCVGRTAVQCTCTCAP